MQFMSCYTIHHIPIPIFRFNPNRHHLDDDLRSSCELNSIFPKSNDLEYDPNTLPDVFIYPVIMPCSNLNLAPPINSDVPFFEKKLPFSSENNYNRWLGLPT